LLSVEGRVIQVRRSRVVARLELLERIPATFLSEADLRPLREMDNSVADFRSRYPASAPPLEAYARSPAAHIARFDQEWVRFEEQWMTRAEHAGLAESRRFEAASERLSEIEQRISDAAHREQGRVLRDDI
jgi:hypothetical protein